VRPANRPRLALLQQARRRVTMAMQIILLVPYAWLNKRGICGCVQSDFQFQKS
jgi:hypothetical protein